MPGDRLELTEQMQLRRFAGVAVFLVEQVLGEMEEDGRAAHVVQMLDRQVDAFADDTLVLGDRRADEVGRQLQYQVRAELAR